MKNVAKITTDIIKSLNRGAALPIETTSFGSKNEKRARPIPIEIADINNVFKVTCIMSFTFKEPIRLFKIKKRKQKLKIPAKAVVKAKAL